MRVSPPDTRICVDCKRTFSRGGRRSIRCHGCSWGEPARIRVRAHAKVCAAVRRGELVNLKVESVPCDDCGERANRYDHRDYSKPLDVIPVCHRCNLRRPPVAVVVARAA